MASIVNKISVYNPSLMSLLSLFTRHATRILNGCIARILQPYNIRVAHKPITSLRRLLTNVKDKDKPEDRQETVYKIKCCDCQATYIGEIGRNLSNATDRTKTSEEKWWRQQSHCWTPFTNETSNRLGLCDMHYVLYRLLSTTTLESCMVY